MIQKEDFILDSFCGLYCGACEIMMSYRIFLDVEEDAVWEDLPEEFSKHITKAEVKCHGCRTDDLFDGCKGCAIRKCASDRKVDSCVICPEYPCVEVKKRIEALPEIGKHLPHTSVMFKNLDLIKNDSVSSWLDDQKKRWSCPDCQTPFSWYQKICIGCGRELDSVKDYKKY